MSGKDDKIKKNKKDYLEKTEKLEQLSNYTKAGEPHDRESRQESIHPDPVLGIHTGEGTQGRQAPHAVSQ